MKRFTLIKAFSICVPVLLFNGCSDEEAFSAGQIQIGSGLGDNFTAGEMTILDDTLGYGEFTEITLNIVDGENNFSAEPLEIRFTSTCTNTGDAHFDTSSGAVIVTNSSGTVSVTYTNDTCDGEDAILATAVYGSQLLQASGTITGGTGSGGSTAADQIPGTNLQFGNNVSGAFTNELLLSASSMDVGDTITVTVSIIDRDTGQQSTDAISVAFESTCVATGSASFSTTPITNSTGVIQTDFTLNDANCGSQTDTITAFATAPGETTSARAQATVDVSGTGGGPTPTTALTLGYGTFSNFTSGSLHIEDSTLAPAGNTIITANIVDDDNRLSTSSHTVDFAYQCTNSGGTATLTPTSVTSSTGVFETTFTDTSCDGEVTIGATATLNNDIQTADGTLTVSATSPVITPELGRGTGTNFVADQIGIDGDTSNAGSLNAGGTATLSVTITDGSGNLLTNEYTVTFGSDCFSTGLADIYDAPGGSNSVTTSTGRATTTYQAQGCSGDDNVRATATGVSNSATGTITVAAATANSIQFISATPETIALQGMTTALVGDSTTVVFKVIDSSGGAIVSHDVNFTLTNETAGIELIDPNPATAGVIDGVTNQSGLVSVVANSGTRHTTFQVIATSASDSNVTGRSSNISIGTGIPDQDSFTIAASSLNPEAWSQIVDVSITARASDRYNNPVADGTTIVFDTEGGSIESECQTVDGACSVNWVSQNPKPLVDYAQNNDPAPTISSNTSINDIGMVTILATVVGEESFGDLDGDGVFSNGDEMEFVDLNDNQQYNASTETLTGDLTEAYLDMNNNGVRDINDPLEPFIDFNNNGSYDSRDGDYNGVGCSSSSTFGAGGDQVTVDCSTTNTIHVRQSMTLIMSSSSANITFWTSSTDYDAGSQLVPDTTDEICVALDSTESFYLQVQDVNGNVMPVGTTITVSVSSGAGSVLSGADYTMPNTAPITVNAIRNVTRRGITIKGPAANTGNGIIIVEVETPKGLKTTQTLDLNVEDTTATCP